MFLDANILFSALCNITRERVADNWLAIERVAEALLERKSLTGDEIRALYDGAAAKEAA